MKVSIVIGEGVKHKYTVENLASATDIIKDYAKENNLICEGPGGSMTMIDSDMPKLLGIAHLFKTTNGVKHYEGSAFIWSK